LGRGLPSKTYGGKKSRKVTKKKKKKSKDTGWGLNWAKKKNVGVERGFLVFDRAQWNLKRAKKKNGKKRKGLRSNKDRVKSVESGAVGNS